MAIVNGGFGKIATIITAGAIVLGAAVGYGTLKGEVKTNKEAVEELRPLVKDNATILSELKAMNERMTRLEQQYDRIEAQLNAH